MASKSPMECGVCQKIFSDERSPRILPCSHNLCSECIKTSISTGLIVCPFCLRSFSAHFPEEFMINDGVLECAKYFLNTRNGCPPPLQRGDSSYLGKVEYIKLEALETNGKLLRILDQSKEQLERALRNGKELEVTLNRINKGIREIVLVRIDEIVLKNKHSTEELDAISNLLKEQSTGLASEQRNLEIIREQLALSHTYKDLASLMDEVEGKGVSSMKWTENLADKLSEEESAIYSKEKEMEVIQDKMKVLSEVLSRVKDEDNCDEPCEEISSTNRRTNSPARQISSAESPIRGAADGPLFPFRYTSNVVEPVDSPETPFRDVLRRMVQQLKQPKTQPQILLTPQPQTPSKTQTQTMLKPQPQMQYQTLSKTQPQSLLKPQPQTQQQTPSKTQPQILLKLQPQTQQQTPSKTRPQILLKLQPQTQQQTPSKTQPQILLKRHPQTQQQTPSKTQPQILLKPQPQTQQQTPSKMRPQTLPKPQPPSWPWNSSSSLFSFDIQKKKGCFEKDRIKHSKPKKFERKYK